jgi:mRNA interferase MazF
MFSTIRRSRTSRSRGVKVKRGDLYRVHKPHGDPKSHRVFVVVSRQVLIESRFSTVICAPVFTTGDGLSTQVAVGPDEGLKHPSWIMCDNLLSLRKTDLTQYVGALPRTKIVELNNALKLALDLP